MFNHSYLILVINAIILSSIDSYSSFNRMNQIKNHKFNYHIKKSNTIFTTDSNHHHHHNVNDNKNNNKYQSSITSLYNTINIHESTTTNNNNTNIVQSLSSQLKVVWDFTRPHTIVGSILSIVCLYLYAIPPIYWKESCFIQSLLKSLIPSLFMNLYITGENIINI